MVQQTFIAHLFVFRAWCSEVTQGQVDLEIPRVPSVCATIGGEDGGMRIGNSEGRIR